MFSYHSLQVPADDAVVGKQQCPLRRAELADIAGGQVGAVFVGEAVAAGVAGGRADLGLIHLIVGFALFGIMIEGTGAAVRVDPGQQIEGPFVHQVGDGLAFGVGLAVFVDDQIDQAQNGFLGDMLAGVVGSADEGSRLGVRQFAENVFPWKCAERAARGPRGCGRW